MEREKRVEVYDWVGMEEVGRGVGEESAERERRMEVKE